MKDLKVRSKLLACFPEYEQFVGNWDSIQWAVNRTAHDKGWWVDDRSGAECIALMHSELSEALEALRNGRKKDVHCNEFENLEVELADCIIRIMDYAGELNLDIAGAMVAKIEYNKTRPHKHGGKAF